MSGFCNEIIPILWALLCSCPAPTETFLDWNNNKLFQSFKISRVQLSKPISANVLRKTKAKEGERKKHIELLQTGTENVSSEQRHSRITMFLV